MRTQYKAIVKSGFELLKSKKNYKQVVIVDKMAFLNFPVCKSSFCNILKDRHTGDDVLWKAAQGIQQLISLELGMQWVTDKFVFSAQSDWTPAMVAAPKVPAGSEMLPVPKPGFTFHTDGRLTIAQKVEFFSTAQQEVLEFGITLNTFTSYFFSRSEREFRLPVEALLKKGVHFKCYLLDPECQECRLYFADREKGQHGESKGVEHIRESIQKLGRLQSEFKKAGYRGTFEVLSYKHVPYNHFMVVDGGTPLGKMLVSHYIYGESRANCPVVEFTRKDSPALYRKYEASLRKLVEGAQPIVRQG